MQTSFAGTLSVTYTFTEATTAAAPAPSALSSLTAGAACLALMRWRRRGAGSVNPTCVPAPS